MRVAERYLWFALFFFPFFLSHAASSLLCVCVWQKEEEEAIFACEIPLPHNAFQYYARTFENLGGCLSCLSELRASFFYTADGDKGENPPCAAKYLLQSGSN